MRSAESRSCPVGRVAEAEIAEPGGRLQVVDADRVRRQLDALPGLVPEVEGEAERRVERAEQQGEEALVPLRADQHANRAEPVAEPRHPLLEGRDLGGSVGDQLGREAEPSGVCSAQRSNWPSAGRRYPVVFSSTVGRARA